jgi:hypothetical protein
MGIVDDLLANAGTYIGVDRDPEGRGESAAKIVVTPLPGGAGVTLDYETFSASNPADRIRGHAEHAVLGRVHGGGSVMVTGHIHAEAVAVLRETDPGVFELGSEQYAFPVRIKVEVPEPGKLRHTWSYGMPGEEPVERDIGELTRID